MGGKQFCCLTVMLPFLLASTSSGFDVNSLPQVGYHPGGISYWNTPYFCNAFYNGKWLEYEPGQWGDNVEVWNNPQFDENGFPRYLNDGKRLRGICFGLHCNYGGDRPGTWPRRSRLAEGHIVLSWRGRADIRLNRGSFIASESSGPEAGMLTNGRRCYLFEDGRHLETLEVYDIDPADPVTDIKVWLSDPNNPEKLSLENQLYHPLFLARLADADWGFIRFMDFQQTNANPQRDWSDRRLPSHCFMTGPLNPREPAAGFRGGRGSGIAFEYMVALCNRANKDLWACVPHMATDDFVRNLARLICFGSDGREPYAREVAYPVYPPLKKSLRVFIEYSNEIWSWGDSFPQGNWAYDRANSLGISKPQFNARRFCRVWQIFRDVFANDEQLVRVASVFTANSSYTCPFLQEIAAYGRSLNPQVEPDVIAVTTYFGNGIQDYVYKKAQSQAGTDDPWFLTGRTFQTGGVERFVSVGPDDPYWSSPAFEHHMDETFNEWRKRLLSGDAREGAGPDAVGLGGGFDMWLREMARTTFDTPKPIIAYEGGPSIYTNDIDTGDSRDDGLTIFMEAMNRRPDFEDIYNIHLNMAKSKGLWSHVAFTDCGSWGKYGQWGHLEYLDQPPGDSVKWQFILNWIDRMKSLRHIDQPKNQVPEFVTGHNLPVAVVGQAYSITIQAGGGDGPLTLEHIGDNLDGGLTVGFVTNNQNSIEIKGTPVRPGYNYVYLRVSDADGDPAWRTFTIKSIGGPNTLVEADFSGTNPAWHLPWTAVYVKAEELAYSGWLKGAGVNTHDGNDGLVWSVQAPTEESAATLALAIDEQEYLAVVIQARDGKALDIRNAKISLGLRRIDYHAPRQFAVMTSVDGFVEEKTVFASERTNSQADVEYTFEFPDRPAFAEIREPFEMRLYGFSGQYAGHKVMLYSFRMEGRIIQL